MFIIKNQSEKDVKKRLSKEDILITEDWRVLVETKIILEPFYKQTIHLQSRAEDEIYGALWEAFPSMKYILSSVLRAME